MSREGIKENGPDIEYLHCFQNAHGKASPLKFMLYHAGKQYNLKEHGITGWVSYKKIKYGELPCIERFDGTVMRDCMAISRYLAAHFHFMPQDTLEYFKCDQISEIFYDIYTHKILPHNFSFNKTKQLEQRKELLDDILPKFLSTIEDRLGENNFLIGDTLTLADFWVGTCLYCDMLDNPKYLFSAEEKNKLFE